MRCAALASTTGERCKLEAGPGGFCDTPSHHLRGQLAPGAREELEAAGLLELEAAPAEYSAPDPPERPVIGVEELAPTHSEPRRAAFAAPDGVQDVPSGAHDGLPDAPGPEAELGARGGDAVRDPAALDDIPDDLLEELREVQELAAERSGEEGGAPPGTPPAGLETEWTGEQCRPLVVMAVNPIFERTDKPPLADVEAELGGEVAAAFVNQYMSALDPANPGHLLAFWCALVFGPRYVPDAVVKLRARIRKRRGEIVQDGERTGNGTRPAPAPDAGEDAADDPLDRLPAL